MRRPYGFVSTACIGISVLLLSVPARAALITYSTRSAFNTAAPGLPIETFESGLVSAGSITSCPGPLSSLTPSDCFAAGAVLPGVTYNATPSPFPQNLQNMAVVGANGFPGVPTTSTTLGPNFFTDTLDVNFGSANAVGFDLFPGPTAGNVLISIYSPANVLINSFTINAPQAGTFFAVTSDAGAGSIGRINVASQTTTPGELIDNLAFGNVNGSVPEPATFVLLGGGLAFVGLLRRRKRRGN